jgi:hypothetical protein
MTAEFDTAYYLSRAAEIEKKAKGAAKMVACRLKFVLSSAKQKNVPLLDILDSLQDEAGASKGEFSRKLREAVSAIRQRRDIKL